MTEQRLFGNEVQSLYLFVVHNFRDVRIHCKNSVFGGLSLKAYIEERAVGIANYSIKNSHIWLFFLFNMVKGCYIDGRIQGYYC